ncbi:ETO1-like protein 2 [Linum perenne]
MSSSSSCICTQQGRKGINQDAMLVWEDFMTEDKLNYMKDGSADEDQLNSMWSLCFIDNLFPIVVGQLEKLFSSTVLMDDQQETEAVEQLCGAVAFKPELQMLHLRAAFYESMGDTLSALRDCEAALCIYPNHTDTLDLYKRTKDRANRQQHSI